MKRMLKPAMLICAGVIICQGTFAATDGSTKDSLVAPASAGSGEALRPATRVAPMNIGAGAKVAAVVNALAGTYYGKNISLMTRPSTGIYCIKPAVNLVSLKQITPVVSVEWGTSSAAVSNALFAYYNQPGSGCGSGYVEIDTWDAGAVLDSRVSFTVVIP